MLARNKGLRLPKHWPRRVRSAVVHVVSMARVAVTVKRARVERLPAHRRPHYPPIERLAILELRAARGWSQAQTAERLLVTPLTIASWTHRLGDEGPDAIVQASEPVNRFPELGAYLVRRLKVFCPRLGSRRIARVLARAALHMSATTVRRILRPPAKRPAKLRRPDNLREITATRPNHVWHIDLTTVPTIGGFWISWFPFALPQRWPFCWWVAAIVDHFSRRAMGTMRFKQEPTAVQVRGFLNRACRRASRWPGHLIADHGPQFNSGEVRDRCKRHGIGLRWGAIGKYGSIAVVERFIRPLKNECTRLLTVVPLAPAAFARELDHFVEWYNAERPHSRFGARTPDEVYSKRFPACRRPRFEPRVRWPRRSPCAEPHALI
jgi:putative transposase